MLKGYLVPHPPLIVKGVGDGTEIPVTRAAYEEIGRETREYCPDVTVVISPHSVVYSDYFHISPGTRASGDFGRFKCPKISFDVEYDGELSDTIADFAERDGIPAGFMGERGADLDHGTLVPLSFIGEIGGSSRIVRVSLSGLPYTSQYRFGMCIQKAVRKLGRRALIIASGDMSHKLGGSYGFSQFGVDHDLYVKECIEQSDIRRLFSIPPEVAENAAECGLRSVMIMCGTFDGLRVKSDVLSYEGPYGVGYMCARFTPGSKCESLLPLIIADKTEKIRTARSHEDAFVKLARENAEHFTRTGETLALPDDLLPEMTDEEAGVFVSIKKDGCLRGCIGTIMPTTESIALEIIQNSVSACSRDTRFVPIRTEELEMLTYSVDVLSPPEPIDDISELDVKKYGVIVTSGRRRGLLLPDLDGVDSAAAQVSIALKKGGIKPYDSYSLERFEVVRHK